MQHSHRRRLPLTAKEGGGSQNRRRNGGEKGRLPYRCQQMLSVLSPDKLTYLLFCDCGTDIHIRKRIQLQTCKV